MATKYPYQPEILIPNPDYHVCVKCKSIVFIPWYKNMATCCGTIIRRVTDKKGEQDEDLVISGIDSSSLVLLWIILVL
jgi:hypothetical protein